MEEEVRLEVAVEAVHELLVVARPGQGAEARAALTGDAEVLELPIDDSWLRDSGPIFVTDGNGRRAASVFAFNGWGEKYTPYDEDARIAGRLVEHLGVPSYDAGMVLEGGSVIVDGAGTALTTEQCLLHPSRNPDLSRDEIEERLLEMAGIADDDLFAPRMERLERAYRDRGRRVAFVEPPVAG